MSKAYNNALKSPDPSSQNGAVIVKRQENGTLDVVANGYNHFYRGIPGEVEDRAQKLREIEHAERDVIYAAGRRGIATEGSIMVCPWAACTACSRALIQAGISKLVRLPQNDAILNPRWEDDGKIADKMLKEAGIEIEDLDIHAGVVLRMGGKEIEF